MWTSIKRYHFFYHRKGFYKFLRSVTIKFAVAMGAILFGLFLFEQYTPGISFYFAKYTVLLSEEVIFIFFFLSETILGLIPPDLFIIWAKGFASPYVVVFFLALLSYVAGLLSYFIGLRISKIKKVGDYVNVKFEKQFKLLRSWGGFIIVIAALLPLPYSTMCLGAGVMNYSLPSLLLLGLFRFLRFFAYAGVLFQVV